MREILMLKNAKSQAKKIVASVAEEKRFQLMLHSLDQGYEIAYERKWDVILIDWDALHLSVIDIIKKIREHTFTPIIVISDKLSSEDCVEVLTCGADDYVRKPFDYKELMARIKVVLRRVHEETTQNSQQFTFKDLRIDEESKVVQKDQQMIQLTKREYELLLNLVKNKNKILNREALLNQVWGFDIAVNPNVVDLYIGYLRKKLDCTKRNRYIKTVHGRGYTLMDDM